MSPGAAPTDFVRVTPLPAVAALQHLTYAVPPELRDAVSVGVRVVVPLGPRRLTALVTALETAAPEGVVCRPILSVMDEAPIIPEGLLRLLEWMADYYLASLADTLSLAVGRALTSTSRRLVRLASPAEKRDGDDAPTGREPSDELFEKPAAAPNGDANANTPQPESDIEQQIVALLRKDGRPMAPVAIAQALGRRTVDRTLAAMAARGLVRIDDVLAAPRAKTRFETVVTVDRLPDDALEAALLSRAPKRRALFEHLRALPGRRATVSELLELFPSATASLTALGAAGLVRTTKEEKLRSPAGHVEADNEPELTGAQREVVDAIGAGLGSFSTFLLQGVTAAGKTEVYMQAIRAALAREEGALVLVPEISLTHQVVARLRARFGNAVAVLHSDLTPGERWDEWRRLARGDARIAVGARSAVLAPVASLGLVVVDEEHDAAYKQDDGVRYHARDTAVMRARLEGCPVVLGSATPSLESWRHAVEGRYRHLRLPARVTPCPPPRIELIDLRGHDVETHGGLSEPLLQAMRDNFEGGGQTLLFLNRRGYARSLQCWDCGVTMECDACSVALTLHQSDRSLRCHHCNARRAVPAACTSCGKGALFSQGLGTQRLEATVRSALPRARVARLDRDAAEKSGLLMETLAAWRRAEVDVLIGTQMITKGHDVPGVTLVGVVQADLSLSVPDFRGAERTFQLLSQVAGRAGRGSEQGRVLVQTRQPGHPAIALAAAHDFDTFAAAELAERSELRYPPVTRLAMLRVEGLERSVVERLAAQGARAMVEAGASDPDFVVRGPAPAVIERVKGRFRYHVHARSSRSSLVRAAVAHARQVLAPAARAAGLRVLVDVDPVDML